MRNYSLLLAQLLKYVGGYKDIDNQYLRDLYNSSILHDIGKVGIPDGILLKPGFLTEDEFLMMQKHTSIGHEALRASSIDLGENSFLKMSMDICLSHHEKWDGTGYPNSLSGNNIPLSARIVSIADVYDALTTRRPYKSAFSHKESIKMMQESSNMFDPEIFKIFIDNNLEFDKISEQYKSEEFDKCIDNL